MVARDGGDRSPVVGGRPRGISSPLRQISQADMAPEARWIPVEDLLVFPCSGARLANRLVGLAEAQQGSDEGPHPPFVVSELRNAIAAGDSRFPQGGLHPPEGQNALG